MAKGKRKNTPSPQPEETAVTARIVTDRGPFWQGRPLRQNQIVTLPAGLFAMLQDRGWAERV
jgi:hypothetical protein